MGQPGVNWKDIQGKIWAEIKIGDLSVKRPPGEAPTRSCGEPAGVALITLDWGTEATMWILAQVQRGRVLNSTWRALTLCYSTHSRGIHGTSFNPEDITWM